jgi:hypothetical protein
MNLSRTRGCVGCGSYNFVISQDGMEVCTNCGFVNPHYVHLVTYPEWDKEAGISVIQEALSTTKGKYKPIFHWNERIAQLTLDLPPMAEKDSARIEHEAFSGKYGAVTDLRPHHVVTMLRKLGLIKYRERWKWILWKLNPAYPMLTIDSQTRDRAETMYKAVEARFWMNKAMMPKSLIRTKTNVMYKPRHNVLPFNYVFRKLMESWGIRDFHWELPLLRSSVKLHVLDDIMCEICKQLGISFSRTPIIKWPKIKKKKIDS